MSNDYQVGGSLNLNSACYVTRVADTQLYEALLRGEFCYVLNSRQMGKSSLRVRVQNRLQQQGYACVSLDMTNIGSKGISPSQWYKSIASQLWRGFNLINKVKLKAWWSEHNRLSPIQQLNLFITYVVLPHLKAEKIFIFIDEIDSVLSLDFSTDDFLALIRYFYDARGEHPEYNRLNFALFGVATPSELINHRRRTPFNIGTAIELTGFTFDEARPLMTGLTSKFKRPEIILQEILYWSGGQPFLTQKLCNLASKNSQQSENILLSRSESEWVKNLVIEKIINNWELQDEPEHLRTIRGRILGNQAKASRLLGLVERIFRHGFIAADDSPEQRYLLLSNLVVRKSGQLIFRNPIYQKIFNLDWIEQQQDKLRPFGKEVDLWLASGGQDKSRLLRGKALDEAQAWANVHNVSLSEYQFLTASSEQEQKAILQKLKIQRLKVVEAKLIQEQILAKSQKFLLTTISIALIVSTCLGIAMLEKYRQATISEVKALSSFSQALFLSNQRFEALIEAIKANQKNPKFPWFGDRKTTLLAESALRQAVYGVAEYNRLSDHIGTVFTVDISPDNQKIVTGGEDKLVRIWQSDGSLLHTLEGHKARIWDAQFSPDGQIIATASRDRTVKLWNQDGKLIVTLSGHRDAVLGVTFSPDGKIIATASGDRTIKFWNLQGKLLNSIDAHDRDINDLAYSPDGKLLATIGSDRKIKLWSVATLQNSAPQPQKIITTSDNDLNSVVFSPDGQLIAVASHDKTIQLWNLQGEAKGVLKGHDAPVSDLAFSADGKTITSVSWDGRIEIWRLDGTILQSIRDTSQRIWGLALSRDGNTIATASDRNGVKLWHPRNSLLTVFREHKAAVIDVTYHPQKDLIASASDDRTIKLINGQGRLQTTWQDKQQTSVLGITYSPDGQNIVSGHSDGTVKLWQISPQDPTQIESVTTLLGHKALVWRIAYSPDGTMFATASEDNTLKIWNHYGELLHTLQGHDDAVKSVSFSPDGELIASGSEDNTIKIWDIQGKLLTTFKEHQAAVVAVDFSPLIETKGYPPRTTYLLASASWDNSAKLWRINRERQQQITGFLATEMTDHSDSLRAVSFSPDGQLIATASQDRSIKLWQSDGKLLKTLFGHDGAVWQVNFRPQGNEIVSSSEDKTVVIWDLEKINRLDLLTYGCNWIQNYLQHNSNVENSDLCQ